MTEFGAVQAIWLREFKVFQREKSRVISSLATPLIWMFFFGVGLSGRVQLDLPAGINYTAFIFPGVLTQTILFGSIFYGLYIVWDRKLDFLKEVLAAPASRASIFLGKVLGGTTDAIVQAVLLLTVGYGLLFVLSPGFQGFNPLGMALSLLVVLAVTMSFSALGLGIGSLFDSFEGFQVVISFLAFPLFFLSGALYPLTDLPPYLTVLTRLNPLTYAVDLLRALLMGQGLIPMWLSAAVLIGWTLLMLGFGTFMFQRMK
jgi:ABC-2 type transport system permease protein